MFLYQLEYVFSRCYTFQHITIGVYHHIAIAMTDHFMITIVTLIAIEIGLNINIV